MKPIDKIKKSNIKCEHCKYYIKPENSYSRGCCKIDGTTVDYWNRCKHFEWTDRHMGDKRMKLIIDIDEEVYNHIKDSGDKYYIHFLTNDESLAIEAIANGIPVNTDGDTISRSALRKNMEFICMGIMAGTEPYNAPLTEIDNAPTVHGIVAFVERPKGEWVHTDNRWGLGEWECNKCHGYSKARDNFCGNCGAEMRGGGDKCG